jgi:hypothetical protein
MENDELPPMWALDMAAKASGYPDWAKVLDTASGAMERAVAAHARTLAKYEKPPVDEAELKRRQDAREAAAKAFERFCNFRRAREVRSGESDDSDFVRAPYFALCNRDGTQPIPVGEWSK